MGYAGGTSADPTYRSLGDHTESLRVYFDPSVISYGDLLDVFWAEHDPFARGWSRQYMNAVFYESPQQRQAVEDSVRRIESARGREVRTRVAPLERFYTAEDYHQKHSLRQFSEFMEAMNAADPSGAWLRDSTAASKLNGYLGGNGTCETVVEEAASFGLGQTLEEKLVRMVCAREGLVGATCPLPKR